MTIIETATAALALLIIVMLALAWCDVGRRGR